MSASLLLLALTAPKAHAWNHTLGVWDRADFPHEWWQSDYTDDSFTSAQVQEDLLLASWQSWETDAPCARLESDYQGIREGFWNNAITDGKSTITFDDPDDRLGEGVLGLTTSTYTGQIAFTLGGDTYTYMYDSDIDFQNDVQWVLDDAIDAGQCSASYSIKGVATHEIGHLWGMDHSCEQGDVCSDLDERYAVMYWSNGPCSTAQSVLKTDDIEGITSLYGPYCEFEANADSDRYGGAPLEVCFDLSCTEDITGVDWTFGDGEVSTETDPCHTYDSKGQFSVSMTINGEGEDCGAWSYTQRERAYVLVCGAPEPGLGFTGLFSYEPYENLIYQMINQADTSVYGCIDTVQWDVFQGDSLIQSINAWSPKIEFPEEGTYRVVLNAAGPGGLTAHEATIEVTDQGTGGCSTAAKGAGTGLAGLLIGFAAALRRRRRT